jgi:hypothetical protein
MVKEKWCLTRQQVIELPKNGFDAKILVFKHQQRMVLM